MARETKHELVRSWTHEKSDYRLLKRHAYVGCAYADEFILERDEKDSLGAPKWVPVYGWTSSNGEQHDKALSALAALVVSDARSKALHASDDKAVAS